MSEIILFKHDSDENPPTMKKGCSICANMKTSEIVLLIILILALLGALIALIVIVALLDERPYKPAVRQRKALFIVVDGIPADLIETLDVPYMKTIQNIGSYTRAYVGGENGTYSETPSVSAPGYMTLLTGTWGNKHNVYDNAIQAPNYNYKNIFRAFKEQYSNKKIAIFSTWTANRVKLVGEGLPMAGNIMFDYKFDGYEFDLDNFPVKPDDGRIFDIDARVTNDASACITEYGPDLSWVYLQYTDDIGHLYGDSERFNQSIKDIDEQVGQIWKAVDYRMQHHNEDWLVIITTDHGRDLETGREHGGQSDRERTTWIITNSQQTNDYFRYFQPAIVDIYPMIAKFMDVNITPESSRELDGVSLIGKISLIKPDIKLEDIQLQISWTVLDPTGNLKIWLSDADLFNNGMQDNYYLLKTVPINQTRTVIAMDGYTSKFYKIILEGQYNTVNRWIYRQ